MQILTAADRSLPNQLSETQCDLNLHSKIDNDHRLEIDAVAKNLRLFPETIRLLLMRPIDFY